MGIEHASDRLPRLWHARSCARRALARGEVGGKVEHAPDGRAGADGTGIAAMLVQHALQARRPILQWSRDGDGWAFEQLQDLAPFFIERRLERHDLGRSTPRGCQRRRDGGGPPAKLPQTRRGDVAGTRVRGGEWKRMKLSCMKN